MILFLCIHEDAKMTSAPRELQVAGSVSANVAEFFDFRCRTISEVGEVRNKDLMTCIQMLLNTISELDEANSVLNFTEHCSC